MSEVPSYFSESSFAFEAIPVVSGSSEGQADFKVS